MIAGIVLCLMGACLAFVPPIRIWSVTDKWKTRGGEGPSRAYISSVDEEGFPCTKAMLAPRKREGIKTFYFTTNTFSLRVASLELHNVWVLF